MLTSLIDNVLRAMISKKIAKKCLKNAKNMVFIIFLHNNYYANINVFLSPVIISRHTCPIMS